ncbi:hypothetical protein PM082_000422 [Marasmius tenuissimus]|nr:hypothetical protein PM082_000422 [Marasmius tenuissimus]
MASEAERVSPLAKDLWKPPADYGFDPHDRKHSYMIVTQCLDAAGFDGQEFYQRVKRELTDKLDTTWLSVDGCAICYETAFDLGKAALMTCVDKKKIYCEECVSTLLHGKKDDEGTVIVDSKKDNQGRVSCPVCGQNHYFVNTMWVLEVERAAIVLEKRKAYEKLKQSRRKA